MSSLSTYFKRVFTEYLNDPASDDEIGVGNIDESISPTWTSEHTFEKGTVQLDTIPDGETRTIPGGTTALYGGEYTIDGYLVVDGTLTIIDGRLSGDGGNISGTGRIRGR